MSQSYKTTGIILKGMPLGETDRLVTILSPELGIIRAVAPGARKQKSQLRGRSELFVVNELLIAKGRSLDKITQAETLESYSGLSRSLGKLAASQYLAELVLSMGLEEQPQAELYELLNQSLRYLEALSLDSNTTILAHLCQAVFDFLALAGLKPQVHACTLTQQTLEPDFSDPHWKVGFSFESGGVVDLEDILEKVTQNLRQLKINRRLDVIELALLQELATGSVVSGKKPIPFDYLDTSITSAWVTVERLLRDYAQYHFGRSIRSATLVDSLFAVSF